VDETSRLLQRARRRHLHHAVQTASLPSYTPHHAATLTLSHLVMHLDPDRRAAFVLTRIVGSSYVEAAQVCGCPIGTIRSWVARARADLVAHLGDRGLTGDHARRTIDRSAGDASTVERQGAPVWRRRDGPCVRISDLTGTTARHRSTT